MVFLLPIIIMIAIGLFYQMRSKDKQREQMIEKGINPDGIGIVEYRKLTNLTNGILLISLSVGLGVAYFLRDYFHLERYITVYITSLLFFVGIGYLINYMIYRRR